MIVSNWREGGWWSRKIFTNYRSTHIELQNHPIVSSLSTALPEMLLDLPANMHWQKEPPCNLFDHWRRAHARLKQHGGDAKYAGIPFRISQPFQSNKLRGFICKHFFSSHPYVSTYSWNNQNRENLQRQANVKSISEFLRVCPSFAYRKIPGTLEETHISMWITAETQLTTRIYWEYPITAQLRLLLR